ncbi:GIY-YIG nuclease family protein [Rasiella rasia]|uniref:GIY-YIG nuclease family protein n=1 Tax=Rasiella rasia TaxID=2744027 RepID=A0A6G6GI66_9FLAO|nr:GIY-YIG nuclease family protein [Rasiella rasia]QIE58214.1 GIY-YIG nuclease family protein [Rasiella rasia]
MQKSFVYILTCADNSYYTGVTSNLIKRLEQHISGFFKDCYTYTKRPVELSFYAEFTDIQMAIDWEKKIKKWSRAKKEALIKGNFEALPNLSKKKFSK